MVAELSEDDFEIKCADRIDNLNKLVHCLRFCQGGPIMVVYPEGTYYAGMTAERIPEFVERHLVEGRPIEERIFARNPLPMA